MSRGKFVSREILDKVDSFVCDGKNDLQISLEMKIPIQEIYRIRRNILKISLYGSKRKCNRCGQNKSKTCFSKKSKYTDWCIICRKKYGGERGSGRPPGTINNNQKEKVKKEETVTCLCLRCDTGFESPVFIGLGGKKDHYRLCNKCHKIVVGMEAVSI
jgi:hypothetical protein